MNLQKLRWDFECDLDPLVILRETHAPLFQRWLVVLQDSNGLYHCHRYFTIGERWECSIDGQGVPLEAVWSWLNDPAAITTQPGHYVKPEPVWED